MKYRKFIKRIFSLLIAVSTLAGSFNMTSYAKTDMSLEDYEEIISTYSVNPETLSFKEYVKQFSDKYSSSEIVIDSSMISRYENEGVPSKPVFYEDYEGLTGTSILSDEETLMEYDFTVDEEGFYYLDLLYYPIEGKTSQIERAVFIDGALPYEELAIVNFNRVWVTDISEKYIDAKGIEVKAWDMDNQGFEVKPETVEAPEWVESHIYDSNGYITEPLKVYLEPGQHTITLISQKEPMLINQIKLTNFERSLNYNEVLKNQDQAGAKDSKGQFIRIEAENADKMSSQMLYPRQDQSSPAVYPSSPKNLLNNTIGGTSWQEAGQWIEWEFDVPESGYYNISTFCKQNFVRGIDVCRKIYIDGEVPFDEMNAYGFSYQQNWREEVLSDEEGNAYKFYLEKGHHVIRMEVVLGDMADIISEVQDTVKELNEIYRRVIYITGVSPDIYRDYQIDASLPNLNGDLKNAKNGIDSAIAKLEVTAGNNSDKLTVLKTMSDQLEELIYDGDRFTEVVSSYKVNVRACGNWITQVLPQPLQMDRIMIYSVDSHEQIKADNWFSRALYEIKRLFYSFIIDYNQIGNVAEDNEESVTITLWVGTGRDQANVIKALIDEHFTNETNINVNVQLVDMNTLLRATLAGEGPDVAIQVANTSGIAGAVLNTGNDTPVNYGLRSAVMDLRTFDDYDQVMTRFSDSAVVPYSFNGATYALPDTQTFPMMFFRKDILAEIGLDVPKTWDEVKVAMTVLAKNQMEFGMLPTEQIFAMLLYQNGGVYYTENGDASALDSDIAVSTFKDYCEYYTDYRLDKATSVEERFRTGECPIIISDYTTYNNLQVSAPDIAGLWDFTVVPGVVMEDGTINHTTGSTGLADIIMANTEHPDECWKFLKWWTSAETQTLYGREMESLMGASARVATANLEALSNLSWPIRDYKELMLQYEQVQGIPQVPGGYYTWRNVNNAFYTVTTDSSSTGRNNYTATPREELMDKVIYINDEIDYKRQEFDLPLASDN